MVAFVIAMLSTVLFDGLLSGQLWPVIQRKLAHAVPLLVDGNGYTIGAAGLIGVWLTFARRLYPRVPDHDVDRARTVPSPQSRRRSR